VILSAIETGGTLPRQPTHPESAASGKKPSVEERLLFLGHLQIVGGSLKAALPDSSTATIIRNADLDIDISGPQSPIRFAVMAASGVGEGSISGKGILKPAETADPTKVSASGFMEIKSWDVAPVFEALSKVRSLPRVSGVLDGYLRFDQGSGNQTKVDGDLTIKRFEATGGPLGTDHPKWDLVDAKLLADITGKKIVIQKFAISSPIWNVESTGWIEGDSAFQLKTAGTLDLSEMVRSFPQTLKIRKGLWVEQGSLKVEAGLDKMGDTGHFEAKADIDTLKGSADGRPVVWNQPILFSTSGEAKDGLLKFEELRLTSAFLDIGGRGDLKNLNIQGTGDIKSGISELGKLFALDGWSGEGQIDLKADIREKSEKQLHLSGALTGTNVMLLQKGRRVIPKSGPTMSFEADIPVPEGSSSTGLKAEGVRFTMDTWLGKADLTAAGLQTDPSRLLPVLKNVELTASMDAGALSQLLSEMDAMPGGMSFSGKTELTCKGDTKDDILSLSDLKMASPQLGILRPNGTVTLKNIETTADEIRIEPSIRSLQAQGLKVKSNAGDIRLTDIHLKDWNDLNSPWGLNAEVQAQLNDALAMVSDPRLMPAGTQIVGLLAGTLKAADAPQGGMDVVADLQVADFSYKPPEGAPIGEKSIHLAAALKKESNANIWNAKAISFTSDPITVTGSGSVSPEKNELAATAKGELDVDLARLSPFLAAWAGTDLTMSGKSKHPFEFRDATDSGKWRIPGPQTHFSTQLTLEHIQGFGLNLTQTTLPIRIENGIITADIKGTANQGTLDLRPKISTDPATGYIAIAPNSQILTDVRLTEALAAELFSRLHPIFSSTAASDGRVGLEMDSFEWPLYQNRMDGTFAGKMSLKQVRLATSGFLQTLIEVLDLKDPSVAIDDQAVAFSCQNGMITTAPLTAMVGKQPVTLSGSMGLDKHIDYTVETPVTQRLVGKDLFPMLEGTAIQIPIGGTVSRPVIDTVKLQLAIAELVGAASNQKVKEQTDKVMDKLEKKANRLFEKIFK